MQAPTTSRQIADHVTQFVRTRFQVADDDEIFGETIQLFDEGYVDSAGIVELIADLEQSFGVRLPDDVLFSERFTTIEGIAETVARVRAQAR